MKKVFLLFILLLTFSLAFSQSLFLNPGKTITTDDPRGIPAYSYSFGTTLHTVTVELELGTSSSELAQAVASGTYFKSMELKSYDLKNKVEYSIVFSNVYLAAFQTTQNSTILLTLQFSSYKMK